MNKRNLEGIQLLLIDVFGLVLSLLIQPVLCVLQHQCQPVTVLLLMARHKNNFR